MDGVLETSSPISLSFFTTKHKKTQQTKQSKLKTVAKKLKIAESMVKNGKEEENEEKKEKEEKEGDVKVHFGKDDETQQNSSPSFHLVPPSATSDISSERFTSISTTQTIPLAESLVFPISIPTIPSAPSLSRLTQISTITPPVEFSSLPTLTTITAIPVIASAESKTISSDETDCEKNGKKMNGDFVEFSNADAQTPKRSEFERLILSHVDEFRQILLDNNILEIPDLSLVKQQLQELIELKEEWKSVRRNELDLLPRTAERGNEGENVRVVEASENTKGLGSASVEDQKPSFPSDENNKTMISKDTKKNTRRPLRGRDLREKEKKKTWSEKTTGMSGAKKEKWNRVSGRSGRQVKLPSDIKRVNTDPVQTNLVSSLLNIDERNRILFPSSDSVPQPVLLFLTL